MANFWISSLRRSCLVGVDESCSGFRESGSRRSLGLRHIANSIGVLTLKVTCVFLTVAAFCINWAGVICARVVWSRFLEAVSTSAKRNFLTNVHPSQLGLTMEYAVPLEVSSQWAFDRMPACHEVGGRPSPHKSPSSGKCPSTHES